ncbi:MAG: Molybdopterin converting factor, small subunit [Pelotomaculum thermopropionicum]|uniref:Molybdopterin converting factor, small subunit n=1 Tax=Pelotomaculum thermopropionicum TaxID=110500 RepID=A0A124FZF1_9FIRM|nr:MAG: Molybdopterin converting factor, small subunit [Pelotomaculum thermopropionicum]
MQIEVRLFSGLESCVPGAKFGQPIKIEVTENFNGRMLLEKLNIPEKMAYSLFVNGINQSFEAFFSDGDRL